MKLSPAVRYAVRILFELAQANGKASAAFLAEKTGMTPRTVENVHAILRANGLTEGTVGAKGGITLLFPLSDISLGRLVALFDNGVAFSVCCGEKSNECPYKDTCETQKAWQKVSRKIQSVLDEIPLSSILEEELPRD